MTNIKNDIEKELLKKLKDFKLEDLRLDNLMKKNYKVFKDLQDKFKDNITDKITVTDIEIYETECDITYTIKTHIPYTIYVFYYEKFTIHKPGIECKPYIKPKKHNSQNPFDNISKCGATFMAINNNPDLTMMEIRYKKGGWVLSALRHCGSTIKILGMLDGSSDGIIRTDITIAPYPPGYSKAEFINYMKVALPGYYAEWMNEGYRVDSIELRPSFFDIFYYNDKFYNFKVFSLDRNDADHSKPDLWQLIGIYDNKQNKFVRLEVNLAVFWEYLQKEINNPGNMYGREKDRTRYEVKALPYKVYTTGNNLLTSIADFQTSEPFRDWGLTFYYAEDINILKDLWDEHEGKHEYNELLYLSCPPNYPTYNVPDIPQEEENMSCKFNDTIARLLVGRIEKLEEELKQIKSENEIITSYPNEWAIKIETHRPQLAIIYIENFSANENETLIGKDTFTTHIPHFDYSKFESLKKTDFPTYTKGQYTAINTLKDNSKIIVFANNNDEALRVINILRKFVLPDYQTDNIKLLQRKDPLRSFLAIPYGVQYFVEGAKKNRSQRKRFYKKGKPIDSNNSPTPTPTPDPFDNIDN